MWWDAHSPRSPRAVGGEPWQQGPEKGHTTSGQAAHPRKGASPLAEGLNSSGNTKGKSAHGTCPGMRDPCQPGRSSQSPGSPQHPAPGPPVGFPSRGAQRRALPAHRLSQPAGTSLRMQHAREKAVQKTYGNVWKRLK